MVDPERLHRLLRRVTDDLGVLRTYAAALDDCDAFVVAVSALL